jgi:transcriptional regulator with XRE-family HTH domain
MRFGDRLRLLRNERQLTQEHLGKALNISGRVIGFYETNDRFPKDEETLKNIANYFDVSVDWLIGRVENPTEFANMNIDCSVIIKYNTIVNGVRNKLASLGIIKDNEELTPEALELIVMHGINPAIEILKLRRVDR